MGEELELRMYGLVNYQFGGSIHAGIQFGHSVVEYSLGYSNDEEYLQWAKNNKTFIILNGGTTNDDLTHVGTMQTHLESLKTNNIKHSFFKEPDINNALTAITFIVDERVFNKVKYPDMVETFTGIIGIDPYQKDNYNKWVKSIGGEKNAFLRTWLPNFRLA